MVGYDTDFEYTIKDFKLLTLDCVIDDHESTQVIFIDLIYGFLGTINIEFKERRCGYISRLFVKEKFRSKGVGKRLINECLRLADKEGCETLSLCITKEDYRENYYKDFGFDTVYQYDNGSFLMSCKL